MIAYLELADYLLIADPDAAIAARLTTFDACPGFDEVWRQPSRRLDFAPQAE